MQAIQAIETSAAVRAIPLSALVRSPLNVRRKEGADISDLAASIDAVGLLQNLVGFEQRQKGGDPTGKIEVVAGGRRLEALELLATAEIITPDHPVPCKIVPEDDAIEVSLSENLREPLHPADQIVAFGELNARGKSVDAIAAAFNLRAVDVLRYLKLAKLAPRFIEMFREDQINIDQMKALALTDDHAIQQQVWDSTPSYNRDALTLRRLLTTDEIDAKRDRVARFVGVDTYEAAGGGVRRDLFSESGEGFIQDAPLLHRLATDKLKEIADSVQAEGLPWVEVRLELDHEEWQGYGRARTIRREPSDEEKSAIDTLSDQLDELQEQMEANEDEDEAEGLEAKWQALDGELDALSAKLETPDPEDVAVAGALVTLTANGEVDVRRGLIRPEDRRLRTQRRDAEAGEGKAKSVHSERLTKRLTAHRTAAMQAVLAGRPATALIVLTHRLALDVFGIGYGRGSTTQIRVETTNLKADAEDMPTSRAYVEMSSRTDGWAQAMPIDDPAALFSWLLEQPQDVVMDLMAFCVAASLNAIHATDSVPAAASALAQAITLDMADYWTPTAESYLNHVPKARILAVLAQALPDEAIGPLQTLKKAQLVEAAAAKLDGRRWVPEVLRS